MTMRLGVIGAGAMGGAILRGAIDGGIVDPERTIVCDADPDRRREAAALGCVTTDEPAQAARAEYLLLAVKPQMFANVAKSIGELSSPTVVISVMAGLESGTIRAALGEQARVIRTMSNTPCRVGAGMSAIAVGDGAAQGDAEFACELLGALGKTVMVDEPHLHAVTAVSGSGPAYVFLLAELMERAGVQLGLEETTARTLAYQTVLGAGRLLEEPDADAAALRAAVTSPKGTTEAAVGVMLERGIELIVIDALTAARDRGRELGGG